MKILFIPVILFVGVILGHSQTATDFTATDCSGNSYNLFTDLDAGKIVVITWTMPCGACVSGSLTAYNIAQSYEATYPGKVKMLLVDDFGNTPCSAINSWGNSNGLGRAIRFSDASIRMNDYGTAGMPKTVAIAPDRSVIFNENNGVNPDSLQAAIDAVLTTTGVKNIPTSIASATVYPNPAAQKAMLNIDLVKNTEVRVCIYNLDGKELQIVYQGKCTFGENLLPLDLSRLSNGIYQIRIEEGESIKSLPILVSR